MTHSSGPRKPRVFAADDPDIVVSEVQEDEAALDDGVSSALGDDDLIHSDGGEKPKRGLIAWGWLLISAILGLGTLAAGLWFTRFVSVAFARDDWVGWIAKGLGGVVVVAIVVLLTKEIYGIIKLERLRALRKQADAALSSKDIKQEKRVVALLAGRLSRRRDMRWAMARFREEERHMRGSGELLALADRVLLARADKKAKIAIYKSARRVGVVTTVVPIAVIVVLFVLFENLRMVRRLAEAYGGRPGFFGGVRLLAWIISHIAATGAIALTDDLFGQFFGQDILRRVSRKLGEGAFNGAMTARLGVAALDICRPLPFVAVKRPRARHIFYQAFPEMRPSEMVKKIVGGKDDAGDKKKATDAPPG